MKAFVTLTLALALPLQFFTGVKGNAASCPTDFDYVHQIPWNSSYCQSKWGDDAGECCEALFILFSIGVAQYFKDSSIFMFPDNVSATACMAEFQEQISSMPTISPPPSFIGCLTNISTYVSSPTLCDDIETKKDWFNLLGTTAIDSSCKGDLSVLSNCNLCHQDIDRVINRLVGMNRNVSQRSALPCLSFMYFYAAAVNEFGPKSPKSASCIFKLGMSFPQKENHRLVIISTSVGTVIIVVSLSAILIFCFLRSSSNRNITHRQFLQRHKNLMRVAVKLNTSAAWYNIQERIEFQRPTYWRIHRLKDVDQMWLSRLEEPSAGGRRPVSGRRSLIAHTGNEFQRPT